MLHDASVLQVLASIWGLYLIVAGVGIIGDRDVYVRAVADYRTGAILGMITGALAFMAGAVTVALHNEWTSPLAIAVSLLGWLSLIKGMVWLAFHKGAVALAERLPAYRGLAPAAGIVLVAFGGWLLYSGLL
jgi:hypothetical protein